MEPTVQPIPPANHDGAEGAAKWAPNGQAIVFAGDNLDPSSHTSQLFVVSADGKSGSARFLFDTQDGKILGWSPAVNGTVAVVAVDNSAKGAIYDGLATINDRLYATDFHNARVEAFDASFLTRPTHGVAGRANETGAIDLISNADLLEQLRAARRQ